jgi:uncharacterized membrane protein
MEIGSIILASALLLTGLMTGIFFTWSNAVKPGFYFNLYSQNVFWLFLFALIIYSIGVFGVTLIGNIPLNELLDKTKLESISLEEIKSLRRTIEIRWNNLNLIRCISSAITFLLLVYSTQLIN